MSDASDFDSEMAEYLQTFLDETDEQLEDLVETMLSLEKAPGNQGDLNEAFRLIHSIKGSAGMMGLDSITVLTHHLEDRFERFRSGTERIDQPTMNLVLRCIDFLRQCSQRLREGERLGNAAELLQELGELERASASSERPSISSTTKTESDPASVTDSIPEEDLAAEASSDPGSTDQPEGEYEDEVGRIRMRIRFRAGLQLADLKARLIATRLGALGELLSCDPDLASLSELDELEAFEILLQSTHSLDQLRTAADVDGVDSIDLKGSPADENLDTEITHEAISPDPIATSESPGVEPAADPTSMESPSLETSDASATADPATADPATIDPATIDPATADPATIDPAPTDPAPTDPAQTDPSPADPAPAAPEPVASDSEAQPRATSAVSETMRVDIGRLDNLMNLTGELVVNRARLVQITAQNQSAFGSAAMSNRIREFCDALRDTLKNVEHGVPNLSSESNLLKQLRTGLELMDEQVEIWDQDRHYSEKMSEAIDQLTLVSHRLQKGVLDARMVPVGPLFNRFKRVVRDLSLERGKQVRLEINGEKTELDKRMIDELGDPLMHLIRNSIDHGMESPEVRVQKGKPETGTVSLEATHSGNNVSIHVRDDGGGIDVEKVRATIIKKGLLSEVVANQLSDEQALDYIWHPGFSTANQVTDVSGRGVGMDVVQDRIRQLSGSIEVVSQREQGTHFTLRLPLTLAIINCLLIRLRGVVFSMPIEAIREIVSIRPDDIIHVQGKQTFDVRDEFIPLVSIEDVFHWNDILEPPLDGSANGGSNQDSAVDVVVLQASGRNMGLKVDELLGSQDMVIKSLSENFIDIRGLAGASILGDGSVCLMLDVGTLFYSAMHRVASATEGKVD